MLQMSVTEVIVLIFKESAALLFISMSYKVFVSGIITGAPCDWEEGRTASSYECIWANFNVKRAKPFEFVWYRTGSYIERFSFCIAMKLISSFMWWSSAGFLLDWGKFVVYEKYILFFFDKYMNMKYNKQALLIYSFILALFIYSCLSRA